MEIDLLGHQAERAYQLLASVVVPRPIAWVTSQNAQGRINAAPFSFFNLMGARTPDLDLIGHMHGGGGYARTTDLFEIPRISYAEWIEREK